MDGVAVDAKPTVSVSDDQASPFISAGFVFRNKEIKAGETCKAQLTLSSDALPGSAPVTFSSVRVQFEGSLKPIAIEHDTSRSAAATMDDGVDTLTLEEEFADNSEDDLPTKIKGRADLTLRPGQRRVLEMAIPLREDGDAEALSVILSYRSDAFDLDYTIKFRETDPATGWSVQGSRKPRQARADARMLHIQPRPPKMEIKAVDPSEQYYTNEMVELRIELRNDEDEPASVKLDVHLFGKQVPAFRVLTDGQEHSADSGEEESRIQGIALGRMSNGSSLGLAVRINPGDAPITHDLHLRATYHLESDAATPITQMLAVQLNVVAPFEANYDLVPRLHHDPWPSLFDYEGLQGLAETAAAPARGFAQQWCLICHYASFALEDLDVVGVDTKVLSCLGGARCNVVKRPEAPSEGLVAAPRTMQEAQFDLVAQKLSLDDRHPVTLDLAFVIRWRRRGAADGQVNTTTMPVGQYLVLGTEPRVLASVLHTAPEASPGLVHLDLTIENPSNHFLTFGLTMEPSDNFAFSGAKQTTMHLLPMSRRTTRYRLLPFVHGTYIRPGLVVRDKYFQKVLRIIPTEGMKIDKDGLLVWVPGEATEM